MILADFKIFVRGTLRRSCRISTFSRVENVSETFCVFASKRRRFSGICERSLNYGDGTAVDRPARWSDAVVLRRATQNPDRGDAGGALAPWRCHVTVALGTAHTPVPTYLRARPRTNPPGPQLQGNR